MTMDLSGKTLGIIHASHITIQAMEPYIREYIPEVEIMHLCDDTIQRDNIKAGAGVIPKVNYFKFAQYAHNLEEAGVDLILLACSTFNYAAELGRPLVNTPIAQIDRPMMEKAVRTGKRIGLAEAGMQIERKTVLCSEAFEEYSKGNIARHNEILVEAIDRLSEEVDCIVMAQLSMSALAPFLKDTRVPVYNSGETGFLRVREMLENME